MPHPVQFLCVEQVDLNKPIVSKLYCQLRVHKYRTHFPKLNYFILYELVAKFM